MNKYLVMFERPESVVCASMFFDRFDAAYDYCDDMENCGHYVEIYERKPIREDGAILGFEYRRVH